MDTVLGDTQDMMQCPRCGEITLYPNEDGDGPHKGLNALSRRDNKTYICPDCGDDEAWFDLFMDRLEQRAELKGEKFVKRLEVSLAPQRMLERMWLVHNKPLNEILGRPWVPYMNRLESIHRDREGEEYGEAQS